MKWLEIFFWIFVFTIFYAYIGYGVLLWILLKIRSAFKRAETKHEENFQPRVTLIIPSFNEEDFIREKIQNTLSLDYPKENLEIIFITDGSTDRTSSIIAEFPQLKLMHRDERRGKIAAMNRAMREIKTPYVIFCDANTILNTTSLKEIVKHYANPAVGGVAGEKKVMHTDGDSAGGGENLYWKYESALKKLDSRFYTVVGAAGELFSFRTDLFEELEEDTLLDDFVLSLKICQKGFRVMYEPQAYAMEKPSANLEEEKKRKIRISAGGFQSMIRLRALLNFFRYPKLSFQYISHRVLRWAVCPFLLPLIALLNLIMVQISNSTFYKLVLVCQFAFYACAFLGWLLTRMQKKAGIFNAPYYFLFMNFSLYLGLGRFLKGNQTVIWEKAKRKA